MRKPDLKTPVHFVGIGGTGMAPLAELCLALGMPTQGSDLSATESTKHLGQLGARIFCEHSAKNLPPTGSVIYSTAIDACNPERSHAHAAPELFETLHRSDLLAKFVNINTSITVAGTHGKTTTTALIAFMLRELGVDPSAAVGGRMLNYNSPALLGKGEYFVAEADESDGSLVNYRPHTSVLTNVGEDHLDHLKNLDAVKTLFATYLSHTDPEGCVVLGWDNKFCRELGSQVKIDKLTYGFVIGSDVRAFEVTTNKGAAHFKAVIERDQVDCHLKLLGRHNIQNALAALATARALELDVHQAAESLAEFQGVARRTSLVFESPKVTIYDDYAHNPDKIAASISSITEAYDDKDVIVIFQPHRFSRLQTMFDNLVAAFKSADHVIVVPTFGAGERSLDEFSTRRVADAISHSSKVSCEAAENFDQAVKAVIKSLKKPAIILTVGAGDVWQCGPLIRDLLNGQNPQSTS